MRILLVAIMIAAMPALASADSFKALVAQIGAKKYCGLQVDRKFYRLTQIMAASQAGVTIASVTESAEDVSGMLDYASKDQLSDFCLDVKRIYMNMKMQVLQNMP